MSRHLNADLLNKITKGDCLDVMTQIPDKSVDMILCDLPYGTTDCKWDVIIPFKPLWEQYERIIKANGAIVLTASQPFTTEVINSRRELFKYEWIWIKNSSSGFVHAKNMSLKTHENVIVFSKGSMGHKSLLGEKRMPYNPQGLIPKKTTHKNALKKFGGTVGKRPSHKSEFTSEYTNYPKSILEFKKDGKRMHPTQKPVALFEYLIRTYTNENETVLDNCIGSGTTAIAAIRTNRNFIGIEQDAEYVEIANRRIDEERNRIQNETGGNDE